MSQNTHHHKPLMVQAPVRALDADGVAVVTAGTVGFAVGVVACWLNYPQLLATGRGWYLGVAITGTLIGLLGLAIALIRKARRRRSARVIEPGAAAAPRRAATGDQAKA